MTLSFLLLAVLAVLLIAGTPVGFALSLTAVAGILATGDRLSIVPQVIFDSLSIYELAAVPLFILMSQILLVGRVGDYLFELINRWVGHWPGGLAIATILSCGFFAAVAGSSTTTAATVGTSALPAMQRYGYPKRLSYGLVAGGGTLGILIPPSIPMVLYSAVTGASVGELYAAGVVPGLIMMAVFITYVVGYHFLGGGLPRFEPLPIGDRIRFTIAHFPALLLPVVVLGSIYAGIVTPTEAAAVGVAYSLLICTVYYRSLTLAALGPALMSTVRITIMLLVIIAGALLLGRVITTLQVAQEMAAALQAFGIGKWTFLLIINVVWIFMGDFLDVASIMMITLPVVFPLAMGYGIDPIWFAVIMVINMELATITPPVGLNLFVIMGIAKEKSMGEILKGVFPFMILILIVMAIVAIWPQTATWLPKQK